MTSVPINVSHDSEAWDDFWREVDEREQQITEAAAEANRAHCERLALHVADYVQPIDDEGADHGRR